MSTSLSIAIVKVPARAAASYEVRIGRALLPTIVPELRQDWAGSRRFVVSDGNVRRHGHLAALLGHEAVGTFVIDPPGEASKTLRTVEAIIRNCNMLDGSLLGIGRGAGNCPIECLMSFLKNPKFRVRPLFQAIQEKLIPLSKQIAWGYHIPYLVSGVMNEHPRAAMKWMESDQREDIVGFYDSIIADDTLA